MFTKPTNANGIRTSKTVNGVTHEYILDGSNILCEKWGNTTLTPLYNVDEEVCGILLNDGAYYFVKNLQGDVIAITDSRGNTVARYSYDAWGKCTITEDTTNCSIASINPYRYRSYYYDSEIDMYYLQSRYYDANVGRFVNADEVVVSCLPIHILNHNMFAYCMNNLVNTDDQTGYVTEFAVAAGKLILACVALVALASWMSTAEFKNSWNQFCQTVGNGLSWIYTTITNGVQAVKKWTLQLVLSATTAVTAYTTFVKADANIRKKVKKNSKDRYWSAAVFNIMGYKYVVIYSAISFSKAKALASIGQSVFAVTKSDARKLAQRFYGVSGPEKGKQNKCSNQYYHYHIMNRVFKNQHIFYLF